MVKLGFLAHFYLKQAIRGKIADLKKMQIRFQFFIFEKIEANLCISAIFKLKNHVFRQKINFFIFRDISRRKNTPIILRIYLFQLNFVKFCSAFKEPFKILLICPIFQFRRFCVTNIKNKENYKIIHYNN